MSISIKPLNYYRRFAINASDHVKKVCLLKNWKSSLEQNSLI